MLLLRLLESSKLDESRSAFLVQLVDSAFLPDTKSWSARMLGFSVRFVFREFLG